MARTARIVVPGYPHHVTQRGNRRQRTFFGDSDYRAYIALMAEWCRRYAIAVWAYCGFYCGFWGRALNNSS